MKVDYFADTDTLYIDLAGRPAAESDEVADGVVLDYDAAGHVVGIEIEQASERADLDRLVVTHIPGKVESVRQ